MTGTFTSELTFGPWASGMMVDGSSRYRTIQPASGGGVEPGYDIVLIAGQSNAVGQVPIGAEPDVTGAYQYVGDSGNVNYRTIQSDITPLLHYAGANVTGKLGPGNTFAAAITPGLVAQGRRLLLVPVALGGTTLVTGSPAQWSPTAPGYLYTNAITQANLAIAAAQAEFPGSNFVGTIWVQGEFDASSGITQAAYVSALNTLIAGFRSSITGAADSWFMIGGMCPGFIALAADNQNINLAHIQVAVEGTNVWYVPGVFGNDDALHYTANGYHLNGTNMGALLAATTAQAMSSQPNFYPTTGRTFTHQLRTANTYIDTAGGHFCTYILGGADAAEFELEQAYLSTPAVNVMKATVVGYRLRYVGNGTNSNTNTTYNITLRTRDGKGNLGAVQNCTVTVKAVGEVDPTAALFQSGEYGIVLDPSDLSTLKQNIAGSTPVTADNDNVGYWVSKHPNAAAYIAQADNTTRPIYKIDANGKSLIRANGNDVLLANTVGFGAALKWSVCYGISGATQATKAIIGEFNSGNSTPFVYLGLASGTGILSYSRNDASSQNGSQATPVASALVGTPQIVTSLMIGSNSTYRTRLATSRGAGGDSTGYTTVALTAVTGPLTTNRTSLFASAPATIANYLTADLYRLVGVAKPLEEYEIANTEDWVNAGTTLVALP